MPPAALPARNTSICGFHPASRALTRTEAPSATNSPVSRRALRISSARMNFTRSFCRLVTARVPREGSGRVFMARPAAEHGGRQQPSAGLLDDGQLAALDHPPTRVEALAQQAIHGERGRTNGVGGED